jgi:IclR family transcriptional regulator, pca regulon regulatory protein
VRIRATGLSVCDEEHIVGSTGLAVPIRGRDGSVVAALNLGVVATRYRARSGELVAMLQDAGRQISERLGHRASGPPS